MHMLHVTHLLHILYWIKIWTPAYMILNLFETFSVPKLGPIRTGPNGPRTKQSVGQRLYHKLEFRFLNGQQCKLTDCMYLHEVAEEEASFTKDDMFKAGFTIDTHRSNLPTPPVQVILLRSMGSN